MITIEFPHVLQLIRREPVRHHLPRALLLPVARDAWSGCFDSTDLALFDVEEIPTHGGSLRIFARHREDRTQAEITRAWPPCATWKRRPRLDRLERLSAIFAERVARVKRDLLEFLIGAKRDGKRIAGYGAPGKGNTLLNYCGIRTDFLDYTVDRNPYKQGKFTPGTHIPIHPPERIAETRPDYVLILPWNLKDEIMEQLAFIREWGGQFVVPIPELAVL